jgi:hypothetical protein
MDEDDLTSGYCIHCTDYGRGRYLWPINDRAEAIDRHVGCPWSLVREQGGRRNVQGPGDQQEGVHSDVE